MSNDSDTYFFDAIETKTGSRPTVISSIVRKSTNGPGESSNFIVEFVTITAEFSDGSEKRFDLVSKRLGFDEDSTKWLYKDFKTEVYVYETIIPELIKSRIKSGLPPLNLPKCYFTSLNDRVMILEDMRNTGFHRRNPPKNKFFSLSEIKDCMTALGSFHASTRDYLNTHPDPGDNLMQKGWLLYQHQFDYLITFILEVTTELMEEYLPELISPEWKSFVENWHEIVAKIDGKLDPDHDVIVHDDFSQPNFHFKETGPDSSSVCIFDFQHARRGWYQIDLVRFILVHTRVGFRLKFLNDVLESYLVSFYNNIEDQSLEKQLSQKFVLEEFDQAYPLGFIFGLWKIHSFHLPDAKWDEIMDGPEISPDTVICYSNLANFTIRNDQEFKTELQLS